jgi:PKD repeat protein
MQSHNCNYGNINLDNMKSMRNFNPRKIILLLLLLITPFLGNLVKAQLIYGSSPFQDSLWAVDTTTWTVVQRTGPTLAGFTITGMNGLAVDPIGHDTYIIMKLSGVTGRVLGKIDLATGVCTQVGNLGDNFSSISFRSDGQLFATTGNGATSNPESLFLVDKNTGTPTLAVPLGNGADGEVICYNWDDGNFYHWSGNSTVVMEKFPATAPYTPVTNIVTSGTTGGETFGAIYLGNNDFIISNIGSQFKHVSAAGVYGNALLSLPDDFRGMVLPPIFSFDSDTVCANDTVTWTMKGMAWDSAVYDWGDGTSSTVFPAGSASHVYSAAGNYTTYAILKNDSVGLDSMTSAPITVLAVPVVFLTPNRDTVSCFVDTLNLTATSGGTRQWYRNGAPIIGANGLGYTATLDGIYNLLKINLNGCADSAHIGVKVNFGDQPVVDLGPDSTICDGDSLCITLSTIPGETFLWSNGSTNNSICISTSGGYDVIAMDSVGCTAMDTVQLTVLLPPSINVSIDTSNCPIIVFSANDPNGTSWLWSFGDGNTGSGSTVSHTYVANGSYAGSLIASNQCFSANDSGTVNINCIIGINNALSNAITVSPNPSNGTFLLNAKLPSASFLHYSITDLNGRKLVDKSSDDLRNNWNERIQLKAAPGIYFLSVEAIGERAVYRLVIE